MAATALLDILRTVRDEKALIVGDDRGRQSRHNARYGGEGGE
jgi:hypothetical protein